MPAHTLEISDQIAQRSDAMPRAQFFGVELAIEMPASAAVHDERTRRANAARGKATHTDPQILFLAAS
jgi:hypothetical protein